MVTLPMPKLMSVIGMTRSEREMVGGLIKNLREANGLTQLDVADKLDIGGGASVFSRYESGTQIISAKRALEIIYGLAVEFDQPVIQSLIAAVPALDQEVRFQQSVAQAEAEDAFLARGTLGWIAIMSGINYTTVYRRLHEN